MRILLTITVLAGVLAIACGDDSGSDLTGISPSASGSASQGPADTGCPKLSAQSPETHTVSIRGAGGYVTPLIVELADNGAERGFGLMNRPCLPENSGMLFVFPADTTTGFYMKDTLIPLSIAFILEDGTIIHIEDMQPNTLDDHFSPEPYRYAIEVQQGWFGQNGIAIGDAVTIPEVISSNSQN